MNNKNENSYNKIKSKSVEDIKQYNINDINKSNEISPSNKEVKDNTIKNESNKKNDNKIINKKRYY